VNFTERNFSDLAKASLRSYDKILFQRNGSIFFNKLSDTGEEKEKEELGVLLSLMENTKIIPDKQSQKELDTSGYTVFLHTSNAGKILVFHIKKQEDTGKVYLFVDKDFSKGFVPEYYVVSDDKLYNEIQRMLSENN